MERKAHSKKSHGTHTHTYIHTIHNVVCDAVVRYWLSVVCDDNTIPIEGVGHNVRDHIALFYADEDIDRAENQDMLKENARRWRDVFNEDIGVVEGMQKGRHGVYFDGGKFSPVMDGPTHSFHKWVAHQIVEN